MLKQIVRDFRISPPSRSFLFILLALSVITTFLPVLEADRPELPTVNGIPVKINFGFRKVATPSFDVNDVTAIDINDYLPSGTIGFELRVATGSIVIGHADNVATGTTSRIGRLVTSGQSYSWDGLSGTFNGVIISNSGTSTVVIDAAWGDWGD